MKTKLGINALTPTHVTKYFIGAIKNEKTQIMFDLIEVPVPPLSGLVTTFKIVPRREHDIMPSVYQ